MPNINDKLSWLRSTWYTPPRGQAPTVPLRCFGPPPPTPIFTNETGTSAEQPEQEQVEEGAVDKYGWIKLDNSQYYNIYSKETVSRHPLDF